MPQLIDMLEVEAAMEDLRQRGAPECLKEGHPGVSARGQVAAIPALTIWRCKEINLGTDESDILLALTEIIALVLSAAVKTVNGVDVDSQFALANICFEQIAGNVGAILAGNAPESLRETWLTTQEGGRA